MARDFNASQQHRLREPAVVQIPKPMIDLNGQRRKLKLCHSATEKWQM